MARLRWLVGLLGVVAVATICLNVFTEQRNAAFADDAWVAVARTLDAYVVQAGAARQQPCRDTMLDRTLPTEVMTRRLQCLDNGVRQLRGLSRVFGEADATVVEHAAQAVLDLPRVDDCLDVSARQQPARPEDDTRQLVDELLARATAEGTAGRPKSALDHATQAESAAREGNDAAGTARALLVQATQLMELARFEEALELARTAAREAELAGEEETAVRSLVIWTQALGRRGEPQIAEALGRVTELRVMAGYAVTALEA